MMIDVTAENYRTANKKHSLILENIFKYLNFTAKLTPTIRKAICLEAQPLVTQTTTDPTLRQYKECCVQKYVLKKK